MTVVLRTEKGSRLTQAEVDANFTVVRNLEKAFATYTSRGALVTAIGAGLTGSDGSIVIANGLAYKFSSGAASLPNLSNLVPVEPAMGEHFGMSTGASDNSTALQAAFTWSGANGRWVTIESGTYTVTANVTLVNGMKIRGADRYQTIIKQGTSFFSNFFSAGLSAVDDVTITDMTLDGQSQLRNSIGSAGALIHGYAFSNWTIERVTLKNSLGYAIGVQGYPNGGAGKTGPQSDLVLRDILMDFCGHGKFKQTTLVGAINSSATSLTVADDTQLDASGGTLQIDDEIIRYGVPSGGVVSVVRGICGTTAASHSDGATVFRLTNSDGIDAKSGFRFHVENVTARYCGDKGINLRCRYADVIGCKAYGNVTGMDFNNNTSQASADITSTLNGSITATATTITLADATSFPSTGTGRVDSETFTWSGKSSNDLTGVVRGLRGTVAVSHNSGAGVAVDPVDDSYDSYINVLGGTAYNNTLSGLGISSGSASSTTHVNVSSFISESNGANGLNINGGTFGSASGRGRIRATINGGSFNKNAVGLSVVNCETFTASGFVAFSNTGNGVTVTNQSNGGVISNYDIRNNGGWGIQETGNTDRMTYGEGSFEDNTSGNLSTAGNNSLSFDQAVWRGVWPTGNNTLTSTTSLQNIFASNTIVPANVTIEFECELQMINLSSSNGDFSFGFDTASGGVCTITDVSYVSLAKKASAASLTSPVHTRSAVTTATALVAANTTTTGYATIKGVLRITTGGTLIPQVALGVATAGTVLSTSCFRWRIVGSNTRAVVGLT